MRKILATALGILSLLATACMPVDLSSLHYRFEVKRNLSGSLEIVAAGVHAQAESDDAKMKADQFCSSGYEELATETLEDLRLSDIRSSSTPAPPPNICDVSAVGDFDDLAAVLITLWGDADYELSKRNERFSATIYPDPDDSDTDEPLAKLSNVSIRYSGPIVSHNAESFSRPEGLLTWSFPYLSKHGLAIELVTSD